MKKYVVLCFFSIIVIFGLLAQNNEKESWDIDWIFNVGDFSVNDIENMGIILSFSSGSTNYYRFTTYSYNISTAIIDYFHFLRFYNNQLKSIEVHIVPHHKSQQEFNLELRQHICRLLQLPEFTHEIPSEGIGGIREYINASPDKKLEITVYNMLFNGVKLIVDYL